MLWSLTALIFGPASFAMAQPTKVPLIGYLWSLSTGALLTRHQMSVNIDRDLNGANAHLVLHVA